jgi:hypothetical protein
MATPNDNAATPWQVEPGKPDDKFTWIYREAGEQRIYLAGTAGRIRIGEAQAACDALNEYHLCTGESR